MPKVSSIVIELKSSRGKFSSIAIELKMDEQRALSSASWSSNKCKWYTAETKFKKKGKP